MVCQVAAITQFHLTDIADPFAVDEDPPRFGFWLDMVPIFGDDQWRTVADNDRPVCLPAHALR